MLTDTSRGEDEVRDRMCAIRAHREQAADSQQSLCADEADSGAEGGCSAGLWGRAEGPQDLPPWFR